MTLFGLKQGTAPKADQLHPPRFQEGQGTSHLYYLDGASFPLGSKANTGV